MFLHKFVWLEVALGDVLREFGGYRTDAHFLELFLQVGSGHFLAFLAGIAPLVRIAGEHS